MNRLINSVLIGVVAFFGLLSAFVLAGLHGVDGTGSAQAQIKGVSVRWSDSPSDRTPFDVTVSIHHPGTVPTRAISITYETVVDGKVMDQGTVRNDGLVAAGKETAFTFTSDFGPDFAGTWLPRHAALGEASELVVRGNFLLASGEVERALPFEWTSAWEGQLRRLFQPLRDCPQPDAAVCLEQTSARWAGGLPLADGSAILRATMSLRNQGSYDLQVREGMMALHLGGTEVARGDVPEVTLPAGGSQDITVDLRFDAGGLDRWWPDHIGRCEASDAQVTLRMDLEDTFGWDAGTATWETASSTYTTSFVCEGGP